MKLPFRIVLVILAVFSVVGYFLFKPVDMDIINAYQQASPALDGFFGYITLFGDELILIILIILAFYCGDKQMGVRLAYLIVFVNMLDVFLKGMFGIGRPFPAEEQIPDLLGQTYDDYSFPSGHSVASGAFWTYLALAIPHPVMWVASGAMIVLVPMSRNYLGVHYPSDAFVGASVGVMCALLFWYFLPRIEKFLGNLPEKLKYAVSILVPIVAWIVISLLIVGVGNDLARADASSSAGLFVGLSVGLLLEEKYVDMEVKEVRSDKKVILIRAMLGILIVMGVYFGMKLAIGDIEVFAVDIIVRFFRYLTLSLVGILLVPFIFAKIEKRG